MTKRVWFATVMVVIEALVIVAVKYLAQTSGMSLSHAWVCSVLMVSSVALSGVWTGVAWCRSGSKRERMAELEKLSVPETITELKKFRDMVNVMLKRERQRHHDELAERISTPEGRKEVADEMLVPLIGKARK
jgi:hypothetical protein